VDDDANAGGSDEDDSMIDRGEVVAAEWTREAGPFAVAKQPPVIDVF
jgi:hypothetical protein